MYLQPDIELCVEDKIGIEELHMETLEEAAVICQASMTSTNVLVLQYPIQQLMKLNII